MKEELLLDWSEIQKVTSELLTSLPDEAYHTRPFEPRFKTFAWEFSCILTTRLGYIRGIRSGRIDGSCFTESDPEMEKLGKGEMVEMLEKAYRDIQSIIGDDLSGKIDYFGTPYDVSAVLYWLLQHEQLHYGKLIIYFSQAGIALPASLKEMWGKDNFSRKEHS